MALSSSPWQPVHRAWTVVAFGVILLSLLLTSLQNYLLFHVLIEIFGIVVAFAMFTVFWNTRRFLNDNWLVLLSIGFLSVALLDLLHMLSFKGMSVFQTDADRATQFWIAARYLQGLTLLGAMLAQNSRIRLSHALTLYSAATAALIIAIITGHFPECFSPETGLTQFKIVSEGIVCAMLIVSLALLVRNRRQFVPETFRLLAAAIAVSIVSELAFSFYATVSDSFNTAGHLLKLVSVYLLYKIFVEQGLRQPYTLLFRDLKHREDALRASEEEMRLITDSLPALISYIDADVHFRFANKAYEEWFGAGVVGKHARDVLGEEVYAMLEPYSERALRGEIVTYTRAVIRSGAKRHVQASYVPRFDDTGKVVGFFALIHDITQRMEAEEALRKSEAEFRATFELAGSAKGQADVRTGRLTRVNRKFCEITGYSEEELLQKTFMDITHPEDRERDLELYRRVVRGELPGWSTEKRYIRKDGQVIWVEVTGSLIDNLDGEPARTVAVINDVTERKRMEDALRESEERFRIAINHAGIVVTNQDRDLRYTWAYNTRVDTPEKIVGKSDEDLLPPDEAERITRIKRQVLETGVGSRDTLEVRRKGKVMLFDLAIQPLHDGRGAVVGITTAAYDITELKRIEQELRNLTQTLEERVAERTFDLRRSEKALRESDERLNLALASAEIGTWTWNIRERRVHFDDYVPPLFGLEIGALSGKEEEVMARVHPDDRAHVRAELSRALATGEPFDYECRIVWPDGSVRYLATRGRVRYDQSRRPQRMSGVSWDVTQRKRLEEALRQAERLAAIGQMITGLSHESRNALQRNRACIEMLSRRLKNQPELLPLLEEASKAQADLQRVHDEVRDYSGHITLECAPYPLTEIWQEAWNHLGPLRAEKNVVLFADIEPAKTVCLVDRFRMRQVFRNLLENSIAACTNSVEIHITVADSELNGRPARKVVLRDTGPGLNPEQAHRIFEPFYTTKTKGTGLGMAIVKRIVESHKGRIEIDPGLGRGLAVTLYLPTE